MKYFSEVRTYLNLKFEFQVFPSLLENTRKLLIPFLDYQSFGFFAKLMCRLRERLVILEVIREFFFLI